MKLNPYLNFAGTCEEAMTFYAKLLGGTCSFMRYGGTPAGERWGAEYTDKILHGYMAAGDMELMGSDAPPSMYTKPQGMTVSIHPETAEEAKRLFDALSEGGEIKMPLQKTFWAEAYGDCVDRFGTPWAINCAAHG